MKMVLKIMEFYRNLGQNFEGNFTKSSEIVMFYS